MTYNDVFWGMHPFWWIIWIILLVWVFILPYNIPGQRNPKDSPLDVLLARYAAGLISTEDYDERKRIITADIANSNK
jgi:putative membrane protein